VAADQLHRIVVEEPVEVVHQRLLTELTPIVSQWKFSLVAQDQRSLTYTRKVVPTWAMVLAIIGLLVFLLGLLFLLVKETQTVLISLSPDGGGGTDIVVTGVQTAAIPLNIQELLTPVPAPSEDLVA
jgi:hypothetical protein